MMTPAATDTTLLLASLEQSPLEDEAEAALIEVLEKRRQVTFSDNMNSPISSHHRRTLTSTYDLSAGSMPMPPLRSRTASDGIAFLTAPPAPAGKSSPARPPLAKRAVSGGHGHRHHRSRGGGARSYAGLRFGDLDVSSLDIDITNAISVESQGSSSTSRPTFRRASSSSRLRHRRVISSLPAGLDPNSSIDSSTMVGLTDAGERSRRIAQALKTFNNPENLGEPSSSTPMPSPSASALPDLLSLMEAKRYQENESFNRGGGTSRGSKGSLQGGSLRGSLMGSLNADTSLQGGSRNGSFQGGSRNGGISFFSVSGGRSSGSHGGTRSKGEASGGARRGRPFFGVTSPWAKDDLSNVESLLQAAERVQELCQIPEVGSEEDEDAFVSEQNAAFLSQLAASHPEVEPIDLEGEGATTDEHTPMLQQARMRRKVQNAHSTNWCYNQAANGPFRKVASWVDNSRNQMRLLAAALDLPYVAECSWSFLQEEVTMYLVPALAVAAFFFYHLGNPSLEKFAHDTTVSGLILFCIRNFITLQLAYTSEYMLVTVLAMRTTLLLDFIGPLSTLYLIQAKGWPLIAILWSLWSFALIQNQYGWLSWTDIEMFTNENVTEGVVRSDKYAEVLVSLIIAGVATTIKRTVLALYLGKRIYFHYKKKVERVMLEMLLMTEVSDLSQAIDDFEFVEEDDKKASLAKGSSIAQTFKSTTMADIAKSQLASIATAENDSEDDDRDDDEQNQTFQDDEPLKISRNSPRWNSLKRVNTDASDEAVPDSPQVGLSVSEDPDGLPPVQSINEPVRNLLRNTSTTSQIKSLLYRWEEPVNKQDKEIADPTVHEILQFRKALSFLEDTHPFGLSFGPAFTRDSCIKSAKALYRRLLALTPGSTVLHFDVIGVLAYNADDSFDERKAKELVKIFRPDKNDEISLLAFVQSCDSAYKKLRYLRASVGNSTLIDKVLENFFNGMFAFCLALGVMSVLNMNPWTLLVSTSTILVSFAFAFGPSAAQIIEGCIMIAVRRPFDLGDRISIADASDKPSDCDPGYHDTWLVEDCNLFTTTLRLSKSNEIATVKNGTIASNKIINHNRSDRALVNFVLSMKSTVTQEEAMIVKSAIEQYIRDNPRTWVTLINFFIIEMDPCNGVTKFAIRAQHQRSWQDLLPVLSARGDLLKFSTEVLIKLGIHYEQRPAVINYVHIKELPDNRMLSEPVVG